MKRNRSTRNLSYEGHDWLSEVISESTSDPRLNKKTPRRNRVWILMGNYHIQGIGLALIIDRRQPFRSRVFKTLNPKIAFQELKYWKESPVCGFYEDFDDSISLSKLCDQLDLSISEQADHFWKTDLGRKLHSGKTFWDSITVLFRRLQAL